MERIELSLQVLETRGLPLTDTPWYDGVNYTLNLANLEKYPIILRINMEILFNRKGICTQCNQGPCKEGKEKCGGLNEDLEGLSGGVSSDWYPVSTKKRGGVSIEQAAEEETDNKKRLDDAVDAENRYSSNSGKVGNSGLPPCKITKHSSTG